MPPAERARRLTRALQARFRIDLFSALAERDFERCLAEAILAAERDAFQRGREAALGRHSPPSLDGGEPPIAPRPTPSADAACATTA